MSAPGRRPTLVVAALAALAVAGVVVLVAAAHVTPVGHNHPGQSGDGVPTMVMTPSASPSGSAHPAQRHKSSVVALAAVFLVAGLLATVAALAIVFWLIRSTLRRRSLPRRIRFAADLEPSALVVAEQVGSAVDRALSELGAGGPVDDAIIRCWLQLEAAADEAGVDRNPSDTPEEAIARVFAAGQVRADPLRTLAALYREARFSRHPMTAADADAARAALTGIVDDLRRRDADRTAYVAP